ncbi:MAG TPA: hemerythrin domain-containing protein [Marinobacter sp.]|nr:hemerythrin domain-containing protein [Marinobacter sp.]
MNAIELLKQDHENVKKAFKEFQELGPQAYKTKKSLAEKICKELTIHTQIEEEIFYPAFRKAVTGEEGLLNEAKVEHDSAKTLIREIQKMDAEEKLFDAKVTVLGEYVEHHIKEEEQEMFPLMRKTKVDLDALGEELEQRKEKLA